MGRDAGRVGTHRRAGGSSPRLATGGDRGTSAHLLRHRVHPPGRGTASARGSTVFDQWLAVSFGRADGHQFRACWRRRRGRQTCCAASGSASRAGERTSTRAQASAASASTGGACTTPGACRPGPGVSTPTCADGPAEAGQLGKDLEGFVMGRTLAVLGSIAFAGAVGGGLLGSGLASRLMPDPGGHGAWYASRAAGITSYLFLWIGLAGGLLMSSAWFDGIIGRARLLAIHQAASIAGVLLGLAHALVLIPDGWTRFGLFDVLVPFGSYYERGDVALGSLAFYLSVIVSFSFWFRKSIGPATWRWVHRSAFIAYAAALWHGLQVGTDSREPWVMAVYFATSLVVVFAVVVRITFMKAPRKRAPAGASVA